MLKYLFNHNIREKFFNKIFFAYAIIVLIFCFTLVYFISVRISSILLEQNITNNTQILESVHTYFESIEVKLKDLTHKIYLPTGYFNNITYLLQDNNDILSDEYIQNKKLITEFLTRNYLNVDSDILHVMLLKIKSSNYIVASRNYNFDTAAFNMLTNVTSKNYTVDILEKSSNIVPSYKLPTENGSYTFSIYKVLADFYNPANITGYISMGFKCDAFKSSYKNMEKNLIGTVMVLSQEGDVLFDSSSKYYGGKFPSFKPIKDMDQSGIIPLNDRIINVRKNEEFNVYIVGIMTKSELYSSIYSTNRLIFLLSSACIVLILLFSYSCTSIFSKRVKKIINAMKEIQEGNFKTKILPINSIDEIGRISAGLNLMCEKIDDYITKEYILEINRKNAEIKQRKAEIYALQAQIDPHFLFNTLEAIRMRVLCLGDKQTSTSIRDLAELFRNSIKNDMVVSIKDELNYCRSYLDLLNLRFDDNIKIEFNVDEQALEFGVIKHILQPLVENAITHGINLNSKKSIIMINCIRMEKDILFSVFDNGNGLDAHKLNEILAKINNDDISVDKIGLSNVHQRIRLIWGGSYGISITSESGKGTEVRFNIQALTVKELRERVQNSYC